MRMPFQIPVEQDHIMGIINIPENGIKKHIVIMCYGFNGYRSDVHRIAVKLGDYLELKSIPLVRFDYRGQGLSEGEMNDVTLESRVNDVCSVIQFVQGCFNDEHVKITLIGFSDGARIASLVANTIDVQNVILWNPIFETKNSSYSQKENGRKKNNMFRNAKSGKWSYQYYGLPVSIGYLNELVNGDSLSCLINSTCNKFCIWGENDRFTKETRDDLIHLFNKTELVPLSGHLFFGKENENLVFEKTYNFLKDNL